MRILVAAVVVLGGMAEARPAPRPRPPFDRNCLSVESAAKLSSCIAKHAPNAKTKMLAPDIELVHNEDAREYLFVRFGETWRAVYYPADENYELVGRSELAIGTQTARRIELGHHLLLGKTSVFFERVTLVCAGGTCTAYVTACTVIQRGRAVETFRGEVRVTTEGGLQLAGDRTHSGAMCRGR